MSVKDSVIGAIVVTGIAVYFGNKLYKKFVGESEDSTYKFTDDEIDYDATQKRSIIISTNPLEIIEVDDPWTPEILATELHNTMSGVNHATYGPTFRSMAWKKVSGLSYDRLRLLHNYWLENIDSDDTLYRWIRDEITLPQSEELDQQDKAERQLRMAGAGF